MKKLLAHNLRNIRKSVKKDFFFLKKIRSREKMIITAILGILLGASWAVTGVLKVLDSVNAPVATAYHDSVVGNAQASLMLADTSGNITPGSIFRVFLVLDSKGIGIDAASFRIRFDPAYLTALEETDGGYFATVAESRVGQDFISLKYIPYGNGSRTVVPSGRGIVSSVTFQAKQAGRAGIAFDRLHTSAANKGINLLGNTMEDLSVTVYSE